ncbi:hypothetical protein C8Q79DRAFT_330721 [Trametes meyenii]|nr:hypothetical protein C8Q79DRAFT_330721 [Trametes meyenii]
MTGSITPGRPYAPTNNPKRPWCCSIFPPKSSLVPTPSEGLPRPCPPLGPPTNVSLLRQSFVCPLFQSGRSPRFPRPLPYVQNPEVDATTTPYPIPAIPRARIEPPSSSRSPCFGSIARRIPARVVQPHAPRRSGVVPSPLRHRTRRHPLPVRRPRGACSGRPSRSPGRSTPRQQRRAARREAARAERRRDRLLGAGPPPGPVPSHPTQNHLKPCCPSVDGLGTCEPPGRRPFTGRPTRGGRRSANLGAITVVRSGSHRRLRLPPPSQVLPGFASHRAPDRTRCRGPSPSCMCARAATSAHMVPVHLPHVPLSAQSDSPPLSRHARGSAPVRRGRERRHGRLRRRLPRGA